LARVFDQIAKNFHEQERLKQLLASSEDFTLRAGFDALDGNGRNFINRYCIDRFMRSLGNTLAYEEIDAFIRFCDQNDD